MRRFIISSHHAVIRDRTYRKEIHSHMHYRIIALDIDGTLTNSAKEIPESTLHALLDIQEKGYTVVLASGRPPGRL